ncbi:hypothetical protein [Acinetobacter haemolyticus]|uniref:hypothetical protein n=1 Tax=Acinetobacter haemolyticus TaxID=29430 RepID=UPI003AF9CB17
MVKHIPESLTIPFSVWMMDKGFVPSRSKKNEFLLKLDKEVLRISVNKITAKGFEMNMVCQKRFLAFCRVFLNKDQNFVKALRMRGDLQISSVKDGEEKRALIQARRNPLSEQFSY